MITKEEKEKIVEKYRILLRACKPFLKKGDVKMIRMAYEMVLQAYRDKRRQSGEPYVYHSVGVARIVAEEIGLGTSSIICALFHDIVRDTDVTIEEIETKFGKSVAYIVQKLTKISTIDTEKASLQSENFIKLLLSMTDDVRVILIKLADRLHNMRTIATRSKEKQAKISFETFYLYAPIAHRLGLYNIKTELEERYMQYTNPEIYRAIAQKIKDTKSKRSKFIKEFIKPINKRLKSEGFECDIKARTKSVFSIWNKIKKQNITLNEVYDLFAVRIIIKNTIKNEKADCWQVYSIVTDIYQPNPKRLRDWISNPKDSGYESLHTTVIGPKKRWIEVQIRTSRMDDIAEKGHASHWRYKESVLGEANDEWLRKIRNKLEISKPYILDSKDNSKIEPYSDKIFVFTPKGDLKQLNAGATVLDFAYEIHTKVGEKCTGAKINNKIVPLKHILKNGDKVKIITSKNQKPKQDWLNFVTSSRAISKIKRALKEDEYKEAETGKAILKRKFKKWKINFNEQNINKLLNHLKIKTPLNLFYLIANEKVAINEIKNILKSSQENNVYKISNEKNNVNGENIAVPFKPKDEEILFIDDKLDNVPYELAKCCNPIFGDHVIGFVTVGKGIKIHRINCPNVARLIKKYPYRIIKVQWKKKRSKKPVFQTDIIITGKDELGIINNITEIISKDLKVNMRSLSVNSKDDGTFEGKVKVLIRDNKNLNELLHKLLKVKGVLKAARIDNYN